MSKIYFGSVEPNGDLEVRVTDVLNYEQVFRVDGAHVGDLVNALTEYHEDGCPRSFDTQTGKTDLL
jgi:hypothetical protein